MRHRQFYIMLGIYSNLNYLVFSTFSIQFLSLNRNCDLDTFILLSINSGLSFNIENVTKSIVDHENVQYQNVVPDATLSVIFREN